VRRTREHSSRDFETELRELRAQLLAMGARCERIVVLAFHGFRDGTVDIIDEVSSLDVQIDRDELEIHALILRILALRQPVAADLRFLATALRFITDLERVGDEAVNIAERAVEKDGPTGLLVVDALSRLASDALEMLHLALDAFIRGDAEQADRVLERDDDVDRQCAAIIATTTAWMTENNGEVQSGLRTIGVAKYLERIADHATNVAEEDIFIVRGEDVRHGRWRSHAADVTSASNR
jgi:phosphate transport system protein